ncbi:MAG: hypothetical protein COZ18_11800 [Flexibacter sp. CG_4_10_14_3_um_filter_32_15]|nr:MAG: hypothetical protein COZ18_11800 [Flexibacter sp. CG_4_10_14_3_um_filter_32_15]
MSSIQEQPANNTNQGSIRTFIDKIITTYAQEDELIQKVIESRLFLNGIRATEYSNDTPDDMQILRKLSNIEKELAKIFD